MNYCRGCYKIVEDDIVYCPECAGKVRFKLWGGIISGLVLCTGLILVLYICIGPDHDITEQAEVQEPKAAWEIELEKDDALMQAGASLRSVGTAPQETALMQGAKANVQTLSVDASNIADYGKEQVLDYNLYDKYSCEVADFNFCFPSGLYNNISCEMSERDGCFGRVIKEVGLTCSDASYVNCSLFARIDGRGLEELCEIAAEYECGFLCNYTTVYTGSEDAAQVVIDGYTDDELTCGVKEVIQADGQYVYQMRLYYPADREDDRIDYYVEMMLRLCGFNKGAGEPVSYEEYERQAKKQ